MQVRIISRAGATLLAFALSLAVSVTARAQGVYTAAVQGTVLNAQKQPLPNVTVLLTNPATGERWGSVTGTTGRYAIENVPVGGPYHLIARTVGYTPEQLNGIFLVLGQRFVGDFTLTASPVELQTVQVTVPKSELDDATRTGASYTISDSLVHSTPSVDRDFQALLEMAPEVSFSQGSLSIAGENNRFNNILIDGSVNNDLFGLADNGLPGGQISARAIPLEAVDQLQLQIAPYNVRLGGFTGGLVNVVTRSGTNEFHGSLLEYFRNQSLVGENIFGQHIPPFANHDFGGSFSGPIVKDVAHFFVAFETRYSQSPTSPTLGSNDTQNIDQIGYSMAAAQQIAQKISSYGVNPGTLSGQTLNNPNPIIFGKVDFQLAPGNTMTISENYASGYNDFIDRNYITSGNYDFSSDGYKIKNWNSTTRFNYDATFGGIFSNSLIISGMLIRDNRPPNSNSPQISVRYTTPSGPDSGSSGNYVLGAEEYSQDNNLNQNIVELTDNLTMALGDHHLTIGTHNEFYQFQNNFFPQAFGQWTFSSVQNFLAGNASEYQIALPLRPGGPYANWTANQLGGYVQDQWAPSDRLTLMGGVRVDVPLIPTAPKQNPTLLSQSGINTASFPNGNAQFSPRIGFNYDLLGDRSTIIRGGTGLFQGRPAFVWLSDAYSNTGVDQTLLTCRGNVVPTFTPVASQQPQTCSGGPGSSPPVPTINTFNSNVQFPQIWRSSLGIDRRLGDGFIAKLDGQYSLTEHQIYLIDQNIKVQGYLAGEGNRPIYGSEPTDPFQYYISPTHLNPNFGPIISGINRSGDYGYSITPQIGKTFGRWLLGSYGEIHASYTYAQSFDRMSLSSSIATSNYQYSELSGNATIFNRPLTPSEWSTPNQIKVSAMNVFPLGIKGSMFYVGRSGTPYSYAVSGDVSGLGVSSGGTTNMIYVPKTINDITLTDANGNVLAAPAKQQVWNQLNSYINSVSCLASARGTIMGRNACRNPWQDIINARIAKDFHVAGQSFELSWDIFNLPNLLDRGWGLYKQVTPFEDADILYTQGFDTQNHRFAYQYTPTPKQVVTDFGTGVFEPSVWRMQVGVHYAF